MHNGCLAIGCCLHWPLCAIFGPCCFGGCRRRNAGRQDSTAVDAGRDRYSDTSHERRLAHGRIPSARAAGGIARAAGSARKLPARTGITGARAYRLSQSYPRSASGQAVFNTRRRRAARASDCHGPMPLGRAYPSSDWPSAAADGQLRGWHLLFMLEGRNGPLAADPQGHQNVILR